ncbi:MAG: hypothetical protein ACR2OV_00305 [Hyphomicrobiaceae bacterium]
MSDDLRTAIAIRMFGLTQAALEGRVWSELTVNAQDHHLSNADVALAAIEHEGYRIVRPIEVEGKVR